MQEFYEKRKEMIEEVKVMGVTDKKILDAMLKIPRHLFVPKNLIEEAYINSPLPIPEAQTISQPYTVAFMLQALELKPGDKVFEIGTGSGWNACLIAEIVGKKGKVYTTEIVKELVDFAKKNFKKFGYKNIEVLHKDGSKGHKKAAPYDKSIVTAACPELPPVLIKELKQNGILVAPVGPMFGQQMIKAKKLKKEIAKENLGSFVFVPLTH